MLLLVLAGIFTAGDVRAQTSLFGESHIINASTYTWESASEDGDFHTDSYSGGALTIRGKISNPNLGEVAGAFTGYYQNGSLNPLTTSSSGPTSYTSATGKSYETLATTVSYAVDLAAGILNVTSSDSYSGPGGSFSVNATNGTGTISGSEAGYIINGSWYMNGFGSVEAYYTSPSGRGYTSRDWSTSYALDANGQLVTTTSETYNGSSGSFTLANGIISGSENGFVVNGAWLVNGTTYGSSPAHGVAEMTLFGAAYQFAESSATTTYWMEGGEVVFSAVTSDSFTAANGAATISQSSALTGVSSKTISASDTYAGGAWGTFQPDGSIIWAARSAPTFTQNQLYVRAGSAGQAVLLNWDGTQGGINHADGVVTDVYTGGGFTLTVSGNAQAVKSNGVPATVSLSGPGLDTASGSFSYGGAFSLPPHEVLTSNPNRTAPTLVTASTTLWVNGSVYPFLHGYQDAQGQFADTYWNEVGGTVTISGVPEDEMAEVVWVSAGPCNGTYSSNEGFVVPNTVISTSAPPPAPPPAFWVAGSLYLPDATAPPPGGPYSYTGPQNRTLSVVSQSSDWLVTLIEADAMPVNQGGMANNSGKVFLLAPLNGGAGPSLPAYAAQTDGTPFAVNDVSDLPAIVQVYGFADANNGRLLYLGTATEDTAEGALAAYYGNDGSPCLLKIRVGAGSPAPVTLSDYAANTHQTGIYHVASHLFQADAQDAPALQLPLRVYAVENSQGNYAMWLLARPTGNAAGSDLPPSFIVRGQPWWFAGIANNVATYLGYYEGQTMVLGAPVSMPDGTTARPVSLTDPVHNAGNPSPLAATEGTLSNLRGSVRLRDGTLVLSGDQTGQQAVVTVQDEFKLHTIAADLDLVGNNLSFGILQGDASLAGALFQFADDSATAGLHSILSRSQAQWGWWKAEGTDAGALRPVMWLGSDHRLSLYKAGAYAAPAIVLDPAGTSSFKGPVRVPKSGDIPMGIYQEGDPP